MQGLPVMYRQNLTGDRSPLENFIYRDSVRAWQVGFSPTLKRLKNFNIFKL